MAYQAQLQNESVHPRLRGELSMPQSVSGVATGSSPLTRGTHGSRIDSWRDRRFIPAYAGNSNHVKRPHSKAPVHPRLRGELV